MRKILIAKFAFLIYCILEQGLFILSEMITFLVISLFSSKESLIFFPKMILFGQQIPHWKLFQISNYITWTDGSLMVLTCWATVLGCAEEPALEPSSGQADRSCEPADLYDHGIRLRTAVWLSFPCSRPSIFLRILKDITSSPRETSGKFANHKDKQTFFCERKQTLRELYTVRGI